MSETKSIILFAAICLLLLAFEDSHCASVATSRKPKTDNGLNCTNHLQIIDRCSSLSTYSYTTSFNAYPLNSIEMKASCDRITDGLKCLKTHSKCMSAFSRRATTTFSSARSRHAKKLCANLNEPRTLDFLDSAICISKSNKRNQMIASERDFISSVQHLALNTTMKWDDRFNSACCVATAYKNRVLKDIEPECSKYREAQEDMINSMIGELLDSVCPDQARLSEICGKIPKLNLTRDWKAASLTGAALDLIISLSESAKDG